MKHFLAACALFVALTFSTASNAQTKFGSEQEAKRHCPSDQVVWLNLPTGIYHLKGERWYGATKRGAYVCKKDADRAGDRETRNGQ
jgi:hypothetical protein